MLIENKEYLEVLEALDLVYSTHSVTLDVNSSFVYSAYEFIAKLNKLIYNFSLNDENVEEITKFAELLGLDAKSFVKYFNSAYMVMNGLSKADSDYIKQKNIKKILS